MDKWGDTSVRKWSKLYHTMLYEQTDYPLRNNDDFRSDYLDGTYIEPVNGSKGEIELSDMIILPNSVPIDYMHMVCLGIFKNLLKLWFDPFHKEEEFYKGKK
ncbi:unnamed protein product [Brachionus calyciflorus]|uniref:Uncharacterized protein n=1 Tax=Brachionus calyciflorus TaxID=104777 RepID=A0A814E4G9_9BILA|nr:unnamed protein product [Brachionus calyciflorus]